MKRVLIALVLILSACSAPSVPPPPATLVAVRAAYPAALSPWLEALRACAVTHPEIGLVADEISETELDPNKADLTLWSGVNPQSGYAVQLGWEAISVIVNRANPVSELTAIELRGLFSGEITDWGKLGGESAPVTVWNYPRESALRQAFESALQAPEQAGRFAVGRLAPEPQAMLEAVAAETGAIGYVPRSWLAKPAAQTVLVVGLDQGLVDALNQPVLALSSTEPDGAVRALMVCLQGGRP